MEQALFLLCLDDATRSPSTNEWLTEAQQLARVLHGSVSFSANRWYDKFMNVIVGSDGVCGMLIEHSVSEGITITRFAEAFLEHWDEYQVQQKIAQPSNAPLKALNRLKSGQRNCLSVDTANPSANTSASPQSSPLESTELTVQVVDENHNLIKLDKIGSSLNLSTAGGLKSVISLQWDLDDYDRSRLVEADLHLNR